MEFNWATILVFPSVEAESQVLFLFSYSSFKENKHVRRSFGANGNKLIEMEIKLTVLLNDKGRKTWCSDV